MNHQQPLSLDPVALDAALDAWQQGDRAPLAALDADADATFALLQRWATLGEIAPPTPHTVPAGHRHRAARHVPPIATEGSSEMSPHPLAPSPGWRTSWNVVAWVLIVALAGGAIWWTVPLLRENSTDPTPPLAGLAQSEATPSATADSLDINYGGDPGRSWVLSDNDPVPGTAQIHGSLGEDIEVVGPPLIVGDSMVVTVKTPGDDSSLRTVSYNLASNTMLWESNIALLGPIVSDGHRGFGMMLDESRTLLPASIDLSNGHLVSWYSADNPYSANVGAMTVNDGLAYVADTMGVIKTFEGPIWYWNLPQFPAGIADRKFSDGFTHRTPWSSVVVTDGSVYSVSPSLTIVQTDRQDAEVTNTINIVDLLLADIDHLDMQLVDNRLVITALRSVSEDSDMRPASVVVLDADTLLPRIRADFPDLRSNLVVTPDWIYAAGRMAEDEPVSLFQIHPVGGTTGAPLVTFDVEKTDQLHLSLAGSLLLVNAGGSEYLMLGTSDWSTVSSGNTADISPTLLVNAPLQLWNDRPISITTDGTILVIGEVS